MAITIGNLDPTVLQSRQHEVPAQKDNITVKLSVDQILGLAEKEDVGLGSVDNTSDAAKPISNAQALVNNAVATALGKRVRVDDDNGFSPGEIEQALNNLGVSDFVKTLLDDVDADAFWSTLGGGSGGTGSQKWWKLPGGLIIQHSSNVVLLTSGGNGIVTFPTAFGVAPIIVATGGDDQTATNARSVGMYNNEQVTTTQFTISVRPNPGAINYRVNWIAAGLAP